MKKNRDRLNLFCSKLELRVKNASWYDGVNVCLFSFLLAMRIVSQRYIMRDDLTIDSNCVTALYHPWRLDDRFFIFNCKKDQNNTVDLSETTSFKAVKTLSGQCAIRLKTYRVVWAKRQRTFWYVLHFFLAKSAMQNSCPWKYVLQRSRPLLLLRDVAWDSYSFFLHSWGKVIVA